MSITQTSYFFCILCKAITIEQISLDKLTNEGQVSLLVISNLFKINNVKDRFENSNGDFMNQKEFFIAMCGCTHFPMTDMPWFYGHSYIYRMWVEEILYLAREQEKDGFIIHQEMVDNFPYPIIYSKTKK